jgi:hypothetical protein
MGNKLSNKRLALIWFYANPDEWDEVHPYVRQNELGACGWIIRNNCSFTWINGYYHDR